MSALERFGLNPDMLAAVANIYDERSFIMRDGGHLSSMRQQCAGISQGCPLSPFLFGILVTVPMTDAQESLSIAAEQQLQAGRLEDVLYADDTLILGVTGQHVGEYMASIEAHGKEYGL